jgi:RNA polymerase sigma-70 factor (ECF subfamily)
MMGLSLEPQEDLDELKVQDHRAFEELVSRYHRQMLTVARSIIGESLAEEVVQEAWISIYRALPRFEGRSTLKTWIYTIVGNQAKSRLRKESRTIALEDIGQAETGYLSGERFEPGGGWRQPPALWDMESPDSMLEEAQLRRCIEHTLSALTQVQRAVFTLRDIEQQSLDDICNILGVSDSNVRVILHRARIKLMQMIDRYQETGEC